MGERGCCQSKILSRAVAPVFAIHLLPAACAIAAAPTFVGSTTGTIANSAIGEASGIAASRMNPNVLWTHNDSGNNPQIFAMTPAGATLASYTLTGTSNIDWEDIAVGPGPLLNTQYIYVGETGDNNLAHDTLAVYRLPEPNVSDTQSPVTTSISGTVKMTFAYPDGRHDAESMFVDPLTRDIYIISKRDTIKHVYRAAYPQATSGTTTLEAVADLSGFDWITAADISPSGNEIIMRPRNPGLQGWMYTRPVGGTIADAFATTPVAVPLLSETQGEAIGFDPQGWGYFTTSEGSNAPIRYFNRIPGNAGTMYWDNDAITAGSYIASGNGMGGTGTWNTSTAKWYTGAANVAWANGNNAVFWGTAGSVTLATGLNVNSLSFKTTGYLLTGQTLTLAGPSITTDTNVSATISSIVTGSAGLTKNGNGTLTLTNNNAYTGPTNVAAGKLVLTKSLTTSTSLSIASTATLAIPAGSAALLKTATVTTAGTGKLDLADNSLIVTGQSLAAVEAQLATGRNNGTAIGNWTGGGIVTSMTDATGASKRTTLAVTTAALAGKNTFASQTVNPADVLVMYTYTGDVNLDRKINADDYFQIDSNYNKPLSIAAYNKGDFNYDGKINADDYFLIDSAFASQGSVFNNAAPADGVSSVPEPISVASILIGVGLLRRRRR